MFYGVEQGVDEKENNMTVFYRKPDQHVARKWLKENIGINFKVLDKELDNDEATKSVPFDDEAD